MLVPAWWLLGSVRVGEGGGGGGEWACGFESVCYGSNIVHGRDSSLIRH